MTSAPVLALVRSTFVAVVLTTATAIPAFARQSAPPSSAAPAAADIIGTYAGTITSPNGDFPPGGVIVIKRDGDKYVVTAGPDTENQMATDKVERKGDALAFQFIPPQDANRLIMFDLSTAGGKLAGKLTMTFEGATSQATLDFQKQ